MLVVRSVDGGLGSLRGLRGLNIGPGDDHRHFEALMVLGAAGLGATAIVLHGKGHSTEAYALGAAGALLGGVLAAFRLLA